MPGSACYDSPVTPSNQGAGLPRELFWRTYRDLLTGGEFHSPAIRSSAISLTKRESDFRPIYAGVNPLHYSILVAPSGFAIEDSLIERGATSLIRDREALVDYLHGLPGRGDLCAVRTLADVAASFELALGCTPFLKLKTSEIAGLAMRASWIYAEWAEQAGTRTPMRRKTSARARSATRARAT
jgi:uncharacterized protein (DUF2225 family)